MKRVIEVIKADSRKKRVNVEVVPPSWSQFLLH